MNASGVLVSEQHTSAYGVELLTSGSAWPLHGLHVMKNAGSHRSAARLVEKAGGQYDSGSIAPKDEVTILERP